MKDWQLSYSGLYPNGVKVKTDRNGEEVRLTIRLKYDDTDPFKVHMCDADAIEVAYAILRAVKQNNDDKEDIVYE